MHCALVSYQCRGWTECGRENSSERSNGGDLTPLEVCYSKHSAEDGDCLKTAHELVVL